MTCNCEKTIFGKCLDCYMKERAQAKIIGDVLRCECGRESLAHGMCKKHWARWYKHGNTHPDHFVDRNKMIKTCNCGREHYAGGYCRRCYAYHKRHA